MCLASGGYYFYKCRVKLTKISDSNKMQEFMDFPTAVPNWKRM
jgi:hypothetical protein